jgi:hypothetical protein
MGEGSEMIKAEFSRISLEPKNGGCGILEVRGAVDDHHAHAMFKEAIQKLGYRGYYVRYMNSPSIRRYLLYGTAGVTVKVDANGQH